MLLINPRGTTAELYPLWGFVCTQCNMPPASKSCRHVWAGIAGGEDTSLLWQCLDDEDSYYGADRRLIFHVPISPDIAIPLLLEEIMISDLRCVKIFVKYNANAFETNPSHLTRPQSTMVGILSPGDGCKTIISMLDNWLSPLVIMSSKPFFCPNKTHSYKAQSYLENNWLYRGTRRFELWSLVSNGACQSCADGLNDLFKDVVPEYEPKKPPWSTDTGTTIKYSRPEPVEVAPPFTFWTEKPGITSSMVDPNIPYTAITFDPNDFFG